VTPLDRAGVPGCVLVLLMVLVVVIIIIIGVVILLLLVLLLLLLLLTLGAARSHWRRLSRGTAISWPRLALTSPGSAGGCRRFGPPRTRQPGATASEVPGSSGPRRAQGDVPKLPCAAAAPPAGSPRPASGAIRGRQSLRPRLRPSPATLDNGAYGATVGPPHRSALRSPRDRPRHDGPPGDRQAESLRVRPRCSSIWHWPSRTT
jgi:hypothetical protein